ncbi:MAG TPA: sugar ABC transporter ATP-binding protein [Candidatus Limnocylindria bacterium]|nr:sugar ABC transporter ATP-binding protein [Candidatus Limnocylindria bacterium]
MDRELIRMEGITKEFPGVKALRGACFDLRAGEVHALVGENGAGKSTLMKILTGVYRKDAGTVHVRGAETDVHGVRDAQNLGIVMIHQELNLMNHLTVAQNIFIGREERGALPLFLSDEKINRKAADILRRLNVTIDPSTRVGDLTVARQQMVEIAKALSYDSEILIMDEPTASLTEGETEELFRVMRILRDEGKGIVYISHRLDELMKVSDRVTVMRDGEHIRTMDTADTSIPEIIRLMVGRELFAQKKGSGVPCDAPVVFEVRGLERGRMVRNVSFSVRRGEILGMAGLVGAGRTETARALFGADRRTAGEILVNGKPVDIRTPADAVRHGIAYLSEDRKRYGLMLGMDVASNAAIAAMERFLRAGAFVRFREVEGNAEGMVRSLDIRTPSVSQLARYLSGGNQQKVVLAKWLTRDCDVLIFDEPTRGIDVGAKSEIYRLLQDLASKGKAIVLISSELPEIMRLCDRVVVMCEGRVTGEAEGDALTQERIMELATRRETVERRMGA